MGSKTTLDPNDFHYMDQNIFFLFPKKKEQHESFSFLGELSLEICHLFFYRKRQVFGITYMNGVESRDGAFKTKV